MKELADDTHSDVPSEVQNSVDSSMGTGAIAYPAIVVRMTRPVKGQGGVGMNASGWMNEWLASTFMIHHDVRKREKNTQK